MSNITMSTHKTKSATDQNDSQAESQAFYYLPADAFPLVHPTHWLTSHFAVGGWSQFQRLGKMLTAHMTAIAPQNGFTWHPHRALEIYTWVLEGTLHHEDSVGGMGDIQAGELQRMFAGNYIEHQELNQTDSLARVIQIWFVAEPEFHHLEPHYQQLGRGQLPATRSGDATIYNLIGDGSPMEQHMKGRLTATTLDAGGRVLITPPRTDESLFLYVTDGAGRFGSAAYGEGALGQYDVMLARPDIAPVQIEAGAEAPVHFLSFYLPRFLV
jgi:redox-sensitive bicupin YhaK (pirin superfamily)